MVNKANAKILSTFETAFEHLVPSDIRLYLVAQGNVINALSKVIRD